MLPTPEENKKALSLAKDSGIELARRAKIVRPIIDQLTSLLYWEQRRSMKKSLDHELDEDCIKYLEYSGINVEYNGAIATDGYKPTVYSYTFTF